MLRVCKLLHWTVREKFYLACEYTNNSFRIYSLKTLIMTEHIITEHVHKNTMKHNQA